MASPVARLGGDQRRAARLGRWLIRLALIVFTLWLAAATFLTLMQRQLIYAPTPFSQADRMPPPQSQSVSLQTEDGLTLGAWFLPAQHAQRAPAVMIFNGNAGNRSNRVPLAQMLNRRGLAVLLFDYRGFGSNPGQPSEAGLLADARAARSYLLSRPDIDPERLIYFGESLGTGVAVALASEQPPAALILRSPFTSLTDVAARHYPWLPVELLLTDRYPSAERIERITAPLLVVAGERDTLIPALQSQRLFERSIAAKRLVLVPGAGHNDADLTAGPPLMEAITRFLDDQRLGDLPARSASGSGRRAG